MNASISSDTICALSTAPGIGAIAVIRVSGKQALTATSALFAKDLSQVESHTAHFGRIRTAAGEIIDEVLITVLLEGKSFTGEHTVEIACHGSNYIQQQILQLLLEQGCRMAEPGEFTMRAFLNGRMDLSQAEAVADLIASESKKTHEIAMRQMRGGFSNELRTLREKLIHFASLVELELDFAEEDVEFADRTQLNELIVEVLTYVRRLTKSFELGNVLKNGVPVAIVGAPNTGKSTLLNQLLGEERAIVSNIAGTTRDVIEETLNIEGILLRLIDTAGIREEAEEIEAMGIERSLEKIRQAQVVLLLTDLSQPEAELAITGNWSNELQQQYPDKNLIVIGNKLDILNQPVNWNFPVPLQTISAKTGDGIEELKKWLVDRILGDFDTQTDTIVTNARHVEALRKTEASLEKAKWGLDTQVTGDFVAMDIRQAMFDLGTITGDISTEDLLGNIFSKFCIGK
jgi:tRNA modification GTPase